MREKNAMETFPLKEGGGGCVLGQCCQVVSQQTPPVNVSNEKQQKVFLWINPFYL
jgi:hypothetical protein